MEAKAYCLGNCFNSSELPLLIKTTMPWWEDQGCVEFLALQFLYVLECVCAALLLF
jgi:hypothetical protein